ncbi:MAG: YbjN domain-containing protein [Intestinibacter bartlettii]|uniref:YbjN domain-containing protein n=1 Tax=Intestinibacter bartlettii TaxID=261299 RepID=UPI0026EAB4A0|nr:YbjN domain-containing protein [Intestinibacter bartlettii]MDO5009694.1 YbjN domain-containing protein [Intestinibacter bartlettii]
MSFFLKKSQLTNELDNINFLHSFDVIQDDDNTLFLKTVQKIDNTEDKCVICLILESDRSYSLINYSIAKLVNHEKKEMMLNLLNKFNSDSLILKYTLDEDNFINASISYIGANDFDAEEFVNLIWIGYQGMSRAYPEIMKVLWC